MIWFGRTDHLITGMDECLIPVIYKKVWSEFHHKHTKQLVH